MSINPEDIRRALHELGATGETDYSRPDIMGDAVDVIDGLLARIAELEGALERCRVDLHHAYLTTRTLNDADRYGATRAFVAALLDNARKAQEP